MTPISSPALLLLQEIDQAPGDANGFYLPKAQEYYLLHDLESFGLIERPEDGSEKYRITFQGWQIIAIKAGDT